MIEHGKGRKRLSADLPAADARPLDLIGSPYLSRWLKDSEAKVRLLQMLEGETRAKVSTCAAKIGDLWAPGARSGGFVPPSAEAADED